MTHPTFSQTICRLADSLALLTQITRALSPLGVLPVAFDPGEMLLYCRESAAFFLLPTRFLLYFRQETAWDLENYLPCPLSDPYPILLLPNGQVRDRGERS